MTLQIIREKGKAPVILCKKHWMDYIIDHTSGPAGTAWYVFHTHSPKWRWITQRKEMYCRVCKGGLQ